MKAAQLLKYDKHAQLEINDLPIPEISTIEVLVKVKVAAVNPLENLITTGSVKLIQNYQLPATMGNELTGVIEKIGSNVTDFKVGDKIYTRLPLNKIGAFAEYAAVDHQAIALLPNNLDFSTGAAAPLTGLTAYQGLHEELSASAGKTIFIPGGSGSFGQMAVPLAKEMGLKVIVSGNARAKEQVMSIGADQYLDYKTDNYWEILHDIDYVIDTLGATEIARELSIMKKGGRLLSLKAGPNKQFAIDHHLPTWKKMLFSLAGKKLDNLAQSAGVSYHFIFVRSNGQQLQEITKIIEKNNIVPAVDPTEFYLKDINQAITYMTTGHPKGKVLIHF
ncbi:NADP-dependent oxidoreductase [Companilactobacillus kimchiensis]|uniref:Alcohol dehydrogenase GroES domain protein n=1 Tax=Companilactobacillus kimchiensis TaxID=993692 RepID=A0A0R2LMN0_9LACO|nr:NADP-dependent oxidoreductase [Companilactobacillus kimchiensis]KRO00722.1 alcohol dehydrogenase GroES domain protein [Companilactobacillus kimchiensis]